MTRLAEWVEQGGGRTMPGVEVELGGRPCADEIRAALARMAASEAFRGSPQLVAFLRYVVEATLRGAADRIKGYTIAVEALGRADDFDPQADPIVRVEAMRLRRALNRYYDNGGKHDAVAIDLPLGSYVPMFRRVTPVASIIPIEPAARTDVPPLVLPQPQHRARWRNANWRRVAACLALVALGGSIYGGLDLWFDFNTPNPQTALAIAQSRAAGSAARPATAYPVIYVGAFQPAGDVGAAQADRLRGKVRDALARFDEIAVISGPPPPEERQRASVDTQASHYALTASLETGGTASSASRSASPTPPTAASPLPASSSACATTAMPPPRRRSCARSRSRWLSPTASSMRASTPCTWARRAAIRAIAA